MSEQDRVASLPVTQVMDLVGHVAASGAILRGLIGSNWREPSAGEATAPRPAAAEASAAPATSPLAARVLTALMDMPDAEFLLMANKVVNRYYAAVAALAPDPSAVRVECMYCHAVQTHRVCEECFKVNGPADYDG